MKRTHLTHVPEGELFRWPSDRFGIHFRRGAKTYGENPQIKAIVVDERSALNGQTIMVSRLLRVAYPIED